MRYFVLSVPGSFCLWPDQLHTGLLDYYTYLQSIVYLERFIYLLTAKLSDGSVPQITNEDATVVS